MQFSAHGPYLLWPNGWMDKTPLGTEVDLGPGHIALDGDTAPPTKAAQQPPLFGPCLLWPRSPISATAEVLFVIYLVSDVHFSNAIWRTCSHVCSTFAQCYIIVSNIIDAFCAKSYRSCMRNLVVSFVGLWVELGWVKNEPTYNSGLIRLLEYHVVLIHSSCAGANVSRRRPSPTNLIISQLVDGHRPMPSTGSVFRQARCHRVEERPSRIQRLEPSLNRELRRIRHVSLGPSLES